MPWGMPPPGQSGPRAGKALWAGSPWALSPDKPSPPNGLRFQGLGTSDLRHNPDQQVALDRVLDTDWGQGRAFQPEGTAGTGAQRTPRDTFAPQLSTSSELGVTGVRDVSGGVWAQTDRCMGS